MVNLPEARLGRAIPSGRPGNNPNREGVSRMDRREFSKIMGAVVAGMVAGSKLSADEKKADAAAKPDTHICKGHNDCKGKGGCKPATGTCAAGKNECKGKGNCAASAAKHDCKGKNACKGQGGCGATAGKNECKGKGNCAVPVKAEHQKAS